MPYYTPAEESKQVLVLSVELTSRPKPQSFSPASRAERNTPPGLDNKSKGGADWDAGAVLGREGDCASSLESSVGAPLMSRGTTTKAWAAKSPDRGSEDHNGTPVIPGLRAENNWTPQQVRLRAAQSRGLGYLGHQEWKLETGGCACSPRVSSFFLPGSVNLGRHHLPWQPAWTAHECTRPPHHPALSSVPISS